eukprot:scaffold32591_cov18-Tisochrysis_lutea.AAC.1
MARGLQKTPTRHTDMGFHAHLQDNMYPLLAVHIMLQMAQVEQLLMRSQRRGRLRTMVVCPGLMYGQGEEDSLLHPVFRTAWEVTAGPAVVYGPGTNKLPMVHVDDLAAYIAAAASKEVSEDWNRGRLACAC